VHAPSHAPSATAATTRHHPFWSLIAAASGRRGKWITLLVWIAIVAAITPFAGKLGDVEENDAAAWLPSDAESLQVEELQPQFAAGDPVPAVIVYQRDGGLNDADRSAIEADRQHLMSLFPGLDPSPATLSADGEAAIVSIPFPADDEAVDGVELMRESIASTGSGMQVYVTGPAAFNHDFENAFAGMDSALLLTTAAVVAVLLLITYRSPILWLLPLLTVAVADQGAMAAVYGLAKHAGITINAQSSGVLPVLVFGVGTDYALLLLARYREELHRHEDHHVALKTAIQRAGPAMLASAATVIVGLMTLLGADLRSNKSLGPVGAAGIFMALIGMMTFLPALLAILGRRVFWPFTPRPGTDTQEDSRFWGGIGRRVSHRPRRVWVVTALLLGVMALGITQINTTLTNADSFREKPDSIRGQELIAASFAAGTTQPAVVIANTAAADRVEQVIAATEGVEEVVRDGEANGVTGFQVTLATEPGTSEAFGLIEELRRDLHDLPEANAMVGGSDASGLDIENANAHDRLFVIPAVLLVVFVILAMLLRSLVAPLMLIATVILSFGAALGASMLIFEHLFGYPGIDPGLPLLGFVFLVALGIDYNIFLMSRVHEEAAHLGTRAGMLKGIAVTGGVITSAGIVLAATFSVLTTMPLVQMVEIGFLVAFGVLLDTFIVRSILVPALTFDIGKRIWWPSRLSRTYIPVPEPARVRSPFDPTVGPGK
jgi:RND superfamily putative drug exporter